MDTELNRNDVSSTRRGFGRAAAFLLAASLVALAALAPGCGRPGQGALTDSEKAADVELLNGALAQELTLVDAYSRGLAALDGRGLALAAEFRGQSQAHVDALTKAIRGLGGRTEAEAAEPEAPRPRERAAALTLAYEEENAALALALEAAPRLATDAPRTLAAALAASHAQHLALLRQALGAGPMAAVPKPFESGTEPPPGAPAVEGG